METEGVDFKGAIELLADRYKVDPRARGRGSAGGRAAQGPRAPARAARAHRDVLRSPAVGVARGRARAGVPAGARPRGGDAARVPRRLRAERVGHRAERHPPRSGFGNRELYDAGLAQKSQKSGRIYDRFRSQIIFPLADARGRVRGFAGRTLGGERRPPAEVRQQPRERPVPQAQPAVRRRPRPSDRREGRQRHRRRGLHGRHRDAPGRAAQQRLHHGHVDDRRPGRRARPPGTGRASSRWTPTAPGKEAMLRAARVAAGRKLDLRVVPLPPGEDPADLVKRAGRR